MAVTDEVVIRFMFKTGVSISEILEQTGTMVFDVTNDSGKSKKNLSSLIRFFILHINRHDDIIGLRLQTVT